MSIFDRPDFDEMFHNAIYNSRTDDVDADVIEAASIELDDWDDDYQPTLYDEAQDLYGGDDYIEQWEVE
jgi:hypothetical protein